MLAKVTSGAVVGLDSVPVTVEVDVASQGLPCFQIVGLPDKAVEEAKERVRAALKNSGADFPPKRITVNLAPADLPKEGPSYDLPIALGILLASEQLKAEIGDSLVLGELSLDGSLRYTNGVLPQVMMAKEEGLKKVYLPKVNAYEASVVDGIDVYPVDSLKDLFLHLIGEKLITSQPKIKLENLLRVSSSEFDFSEIKGQEQAKRALEIAAAGGHNVLLKGPPGAGKTLMARALSSILPKLSFDEALEVTKVYSVSGLLKSDEPLVRTRPFRNPHHTTSHIGLVGGGSYPRPGEISLAHRGVLFLDEFPEFPRFCLESLRGPLEDGSVTVSRAVGTLTFPAKFILIAASNPCPCGFLGDSQKECICTPNQIIKYQKRLSGPILDRIDMHIEVPAVKVEKLTGDYKAEASAEIRERVQKSRDKQLERFKDLKIASNSEMGPKEIKEFCKMDLETLNLLRVAISQFRLSARGYHRIIKLARTIADLEDSPDIGSHHIAEAIQYRAKEES